MSEKHSRQAATWRRNAKGAGGAHSRSHDTTRAKAGQAVFNSSGRPVGHIEGGWLVKVGLDPSRHMMRAPRGWATDRAHLDLPIVGVRLVTVDGDRWEASVDLWRRHGILVSRGYGTQVLLPERYFRRTPAGQPLTRQLSLFSEARP